MFIDKINEVLKYSIPGQATKEEILTCFEVYTCKLDDIETLHKLHVKNLAVAKNRKNKLPKNCKEITIKR